jgi:Peptidase family M23
MNVEAILADVAGDVSLVGVVWYLGHTPVDAEWDAVPMPEAGNTLTPRQYQARWMAIFAAHNPTAATAALAVTPSTTTSTMVASGPEGTAPATMSAGSVCGVVRDGWSLPLDGLAPDLYLRPHHDYPAADLPVATGSAVHAIHAGVVTRAGGWGGNCYPDATGCPDICGIGVVVTDAANAAVEWTYCHLTTSAVTVGATVAAGDVIGRSGNTGHSSGPHLHVGIRVRGTSVCPQPLLYALAATAALLPDPMSLPTSGCFDRKNP